MSNKGGKWLPYNLDDGPHDCRAKNQAQNTEVSPSKDKQTKQEITLEQVKKKLESIGITLDLDKLMNQK